MADIFTKDDARKIVEYKVIWFWGDSIHETMYKDLVWLLQKNSLIDLGSLRNKLEVTYMNDSLVRGKLLHKGRNYTEVRCFESLSISTKIEFTFVTECLSEEIRRKLANLTAEDTPDIIIMNSCLWDITRWGPDGVNKYKKNIRDLLRLLQDHLPSRTLVIWTTTPPLSDEPQGGFLIKQLNFMKTFLRFEVMEANMFVKQEFVSHGYDVLDIHYHLMFQIHRRRPDGIHWNPDAIRHITNLLLTHIAISFKMALPKNINLPMVKNIQLTGDHCDAGNNNNNISSITVDKTLHGNLINQNKSDTNSTNKEDVRTIVNSLPQLLANRVEKPKNKTSSTSKKKIKKNKRSSRHSGRFFLNDQNIAPSNFSCYDYSNYNINFPIRNKYQRQSTEQVQFYWPY